MKPFRFSLQSIRVLREQKEQAAQRRYGAAVEACREASARLNAASRALADAWKSVRSELAGGTSAAQLGRSRAWCGILEIRERDLTAALQKARNAADAALGELMTVMRDRKAMDRFYSRSREAYNTEARREEQKILDETGLRCSASGGPFRAETA